MRLILLIALALFTWSAHINAQESVVTVQGSGSASMVPDAFVLTFVVEEKGPLVTKLNESIKQQMTQIVKFLKQQNIEEKNIQSMRVHLHPNYVVNNRGRDQDGFVMSREIRVQGEDLSSFDSIIDGVVKRGADRIANFRFISSSEREAYEQALVAAVNSAMSKATLIAKRADIAIGDIISISETGASRPVPMMRAEMAADVSSSLPGQESVTASVSVTFKVKTKE